MEDKIIVSTQLSKDEFVKARLHLLNKNLALKILQYIGYLFAFIGVVNSISSKSFQFFIILLGSFFAFGIRFISQVSAKKAFDTDQRIKEKIIYTIDNEYIEITGESFQSKMTWDKIFKVSENNDCYFIWQNKQSANVLGKKYFKEKEHSIFKNIVFSKGKTVNKLKIS